MYFIKLSHLYHHVLLDVERAGYLWKDLLAVRFKLAMDELGPLIHGSYEEYLKYYPKSGFMQVRQIMISEMNLKRWPSVKDQFR